MRAILDQKHVTSGPNGTAVIGWASWVCFGVQC
jgi:hypothetical protein